MFKIVPHEKTALGWRFAVVDERRQDLPLAVDWYTVARQRCAAMNAAAGLGSVAEEIKPS